MTDLEETSTRLREYLDRTTPKPPPPPPAGTAPPPAAPAPDAGSAPEAGPAGSTSDGDAADDADGRSQDSASQGSRSDRDAGVVDAGAFADPDDDDDEDGVEVVSAEPRGDRGAVSAPPPDSRSEAPGASGDGAGGAQPSEGTSGAAVGDQTPAGTSPSPNGVEPTLGGASPPADGRRDEGGRRGRGRRRRRGGARRERPEPVPPPRSWSSSTARRRRSSTRTASRPRSRTRSAAPCACRRAGASSSTRPRLSSPSTSTPGRLTEEEDIEATALKTDLEAVPEVARQLRLRDLGGVIVIDFIDLKESSHIRQVENALRQALARDRARIRMGRMGPFGCLELTRQRIRPALASVTHVACPTCNGLGRRRHPLGLALRLLRELRARAARSRGHGGMEVRLPALVLDALRRQKGPALADLEAALSGPLRLQADAAIPYGSWSIKGIPIKGAAVSGRPPEPVGPGAPTNSTTTAAGRRPDAGGVGASRSGSAAERPGGARGPTVVAGLEDRRERGTFPRFDRPAAREFSGRRFVVARSCRPPRTPLPCRTPSSPTVAASTP